MAVDPEGACSRAFVENKAALRATPQSSGPMGAQEAPGEWHASGLGAALRSLV